MTTSRALLLPILLGAAVAAGASGPTFIEDDYDGARALARERKVPLFVEVWAPW